MKTSTIIGIILIILGVLGFIFKSVSFTTEKEVADVGPIEIKSEEKETVPIPEILSGIAIAGGIILIAVGSRKGT
jgi:hypothetical protein